MNYYQWGGFNSIYLRINTFNGITVRFLSNVPILSLDNVEVIDDWNGFSVSNSIKIFKVNM